LLLDLLPTLTKDMIITEANIDFEPGEAPKLRFEVLIPEIKKY